MSESQRWADILAMANSGDTEDFTRMLHKYAESHSGDLLVGFDVFNTSLSIINVLMTAVAEYLGMEEEELEGFVLMEKFKHELFGDD